jgi:DNA invertase Pin-like site-specific DNA recombinase
MQLRELREFCARRKWAHILEYKDVGESGAKHSRPELDEMLAACRRRQVDVVVVWKFDRLGRSTRHLIETFELFRGLGIEFVSVTEGIDTSLPAGKMVFQMLAVLAEFERDILRERIMTGMAAAKARLESGPYRVIRQGKEHVVTTLGRPRASVDLEAVAQAVKCGHSWGKIARDLGISRRTARRYYQAALEGAGKRLSEGNALSP